MKILSLFLITLVFAYPTYSSEANNVNIDRLMQNKNIHFTDRDKSKKEAIELIDAVLRKQGDLGAYGDLSAGLDSLTHDTDITIEEISGFYHISLSPLSGEGHDFSFSIDKHSKSMVDVVIGNIEPPPDSD